MFLKRNRELKPEAIDYPVNLPHGAVVETETGFWYIKQDSKTQILSRLRVPNEKVLASWRFTNVPLYTEDSLRGIVVSGKLPYRDGTVLRSYSDLGKTYYVSASKLRLITNQDWLLRLGINEFDVIIVSKEDIDYHLIGEDLV